MNRKVRVNAEVRAGRAELVSREQRLAQLMQREPRDPFEIMRDVLHDCDSAYLLERQPVVDGEPMSAEQLERYAQSMEKAAYHARMLIQSKAYASWSEAQHRKVELEGMAISAVINRVLEGVASWLRLSGLDKASVEQIRAWSRDATAQGLRQLSGSQIPKGAEPRLKPADPIPVSIALVAESQLVAAPQAQPEPTPEPPAVELQVMPPKRQRVDSERSLTIDGQVISKPWRNNAR